MDELEKLDYSSLEKRLGIDIVIVLKSFELTWGRRRVPAQTALSAICHQE